MKKLLLIVLLFIALPFSAQAKTSNATVDIYAYTSTLGHGVGIAMPVSQNISGRVALSQATFILPPDILPLTLKLQSVGALADWHLFSGITHLTGGVIYNNNIFSSTEDGPPINFTFNKVAPYLGFGWSGRASNTGFSLKTDIGIMFHGAPKSTVAKAESDMAEYTMYPVISVGMGYAF